MQKASSEKTRDVVHQAVAFPEKRDKDSARAQADTNMEEMTPPTTTHPVPKHLPVHWQAPQTFTIQCREVPNCFAERLHAQKKTCDTSL